jgi:PERQ amino acid-rich with GYF domain-containing protein
MSMHFAPQWVKPIKPTGTVTNQGHDTAMPGKQPTTPTSNVPFPALSHSSNTTPASGINPPMSYSRAIHTPQSPSFPNDGPYFPEEGGKDGDPNPHPFRYSRDQILALWDEEKVKNTPIELAEMLDNGGVLVSKVVNKPIGLREMSDIEKKVSRLHNSEGSWLIVS